MAIASENSRNPHTKATKCRHMEHSETPAGSTGTLAEQVYRRLTAAILAGELVPGAKVSEPALARQYGVSRGPLREALHRLQERKLITRSANQGARIVKLSPETLVELFVVREALEGMAARLAVSHATDAEIAELRAAVTRNADVLKNKEPVTADFTERHDDDFHFSIAQCSRNPMLINLLCGELYPLLRLYRGLPVGVRPRGHRAVVEHERVVSAIEDRDPDLAEMLMRRHIAAARVRRETALAKGNDSDPTGHSEIFRPATTTTAVQPQGISRPRSPKRK
jgi:DNA-binding GntR family transcriptional regulator